MKKVSLSLNLLDISIIYIFIIIISFSTIIDLILWIARLSYNKSIIMVCIIIIFTVSMIYIFLLMPSKTKLT